ncbi:DUF7619 domain-containing protein [Flavobacterium facile]|uniref:DUF7619 domain-containing protein n=1 Tax=Flavobacterium facile TaxID=2893174 RepID=UPI002E75B81B|nr:T9SS type A sorting domain-containing protein [Flavobacterium sp. T-12]
MKKIVLVLILITNHLLFAQVQHINIGQEESLNQFVEVMNQFSPKNHPGTGTKQQIVWKSQDNIYLYGNDNLAYNSGNSSFWVYNLNIKQWKCLQDNNVATNFGTKGVFNTTNTPGRRSQSITFVDNSGNLFLLGGTYGGGTNDLWKYDISLNLWAWIGGYDNHAAGIVGNYGPIGVESSSYFPSSRIFSNPIVSNDGMIYIYGGHAPTFDGYDRYDLWKYNPNNNSWTLLYKPTNNSQNIGIIGVEDTNNRPGCLLGYTSWFFDNCLWYYGGSSENNTAVNSVQKKVWKFNLLTQKWTCVKDPNTIDAIYGQQNTSNIVNTPPSLIHMSNSVVHNNEAYFIGGYELGGNTTNELNRGHHGSLWKYNMLTNQWTWLKGKQLTKHPGFHGKKGIERSENLPSSRLNSFLLIENNALKLYGGNAFQANGAINTQEFWNYNISTNNFTWIDGITTRYDHINQNSTYYFEELNTASVYNVVEPTKLKWGEKGSKLWFFNTLNNQPFLGNAFFGGMFEYDIETSTCYKIKEFGSTPYNYGVYGQKNVADVSNIPPYRENACLWETDTKLYLMGGFGMTGYSYYYNDFWVFDKATKNWTWIGGSKNNDTPYTFYSNIGEANSNNYPRSRAKAQTWVDADGNLWLFSGVNDQSYYLNDFWKFDTITNQWVLMGGNQNNCTNSSAYFLDTYPPFVHSAATWSKGNDLYFYGGNGLGKESNLFTAGLLSDIWKYSTTNNVWTKVLGNRKIGINGSYGIKEYGFITNVPSSRKDFVSWSDIYGNLWLYGGFGKGTSGNSQSDLFDLWKYDLTLNLWIWMDGLNYQPSPFDPLFDANNYNFPKRVIDRSVTYKSNNKYFLASGISNNLWEFDFNSYQKDYNSIEGTARFDVNNNCDINDIVVPNLKLKINNSTDNQFYTNLEGYYKIYTPFQNNTLEAVGLAENNTFFNINPTTTTINFSGFNSTQIQNFCVSPNGLHNDVEIVVIPIIDARPGFNNLYKIIYKNKGNSTISGSLQFNYNDNINDYISSSIPPTLQSFGSLEWTYNNLVPFESRSIMVTLNLNTPIETPAVNGGDLINFIGIILPLAGDENSNDNTFTLSQLVVNSFDPNDKICLQGNLVEANRIGNYVTYKIRFKNNGTSKAQNIVIKDNIDPNKFDIESIITLDASHNYRKLITSTNNLEYHFENINLPYDNANNDGYVVFKIKTKSTLVAGDTFSNLANIYFDYNSPIVTNNYTTTIQNTLGLQENELLNTISVYPNPVKDMLHFQTKEKVLKVEIYDVAGRIVSSKSIIENKINLSELKAGNYFLKLYTEKGIMHTKIIKE